jgi:hypothetical protein
MMMKRIVAIKQAIFYFVICALKLTHIKVLFNTRLHNFSNNNQIYLDFMSCPIDRKMKNKLQSEFWFQVPDNR